MISKVEQLKKQSALAAVEALIADKTAAAAASKYAAESAKDEIINGIGGTSQAMQYVHELRNAENLNEEIARLAELAVELKASLMQQV